AGGVGADSRERLVAPPSTRRAWSRGLAMHFEYAVNEIDNPVVRDSGTRIRGGLASARDGEARQRDLDHEIGPGRMRVGVITRRAADDADVRFRLGPNVEADRAPDRDEPTVAELALEGPRDEHHRGTVRARMRLLDEQKSVEQLDGVVLVENAAIDQLGVLAAGPAIQRRPRGLFHCRYAIGAFRDGQCRRGDTP